MNENQAEERWIRAELLLDEGNAHGGELWDLGALGVEIQDKETFMEGGTIAPVPDGDARLIAFFSGDQEPSELEKYIKESYMHPIKYMDVSYYDDRSWETAWQTYFKPVRLSRRAIVGPPWETFEAPTEWEESDGEVERVEDGVKIVINPGLAFGTGTHETTRLVASILDDLIAGKHADLIGSFEGENNAQASRYEAFLDVGCGSGILSILVHKLGIEDVVGIDIDPDAIQAANETLETFGLHEISLSTTPLSEVGGPYPLVAANILGHIILREKESLAKVVAPEGLIVVSGVLVTEADSFMEKFSSAGFKEIYRTMMNEWAAFIFQRLSVEEAQT